MESVYRYKHNPIVRKIVVAMLIPTILMNLTTSIASMADTMIIGRYLDDSALSVVTFATPIYMIINVFSALFAVGGCIAMSIDSGKGDRENANKAFSISLELLALMGSLMVIAGLFFGRNITHWLGASEDVFELVFAYARIILLGTPFLALNTGLAFFVRNDGRPTLSMIGMFSSIAVDIVLNFVFVGHMNLGVVGAAYSTVLGSVVSIAVLSTHFFSSKNTLKFRFSMDKMALRVIKNGGSAALQFIYQFATILILNHLIAWLAGTDGVVLYTVVFNLSTVSLSLFEGISQTIQPMASNYFGEKSYRNIRETMRLALIAIVAICGSVMLLLEIWPQMVPVAFGIESPELIAQASVAVRIYAASMIITTVNVVIGYYLQSIEQGALAAVIVSLRSFVLFLSAVLILGWRFGLNGVWAAYLVSEMLTFVICLLIIQRKRATMRSDAISPNMFLLDEKIEAGIECLTFVDGKTGFDSFGSEICRYLPAAEYVSCLKEHLSSRKSGCVEMEINHEAGLIYIRDNLHYGEAPLESLRAAVGAENVNHDAVLGWNRLTVTRSKE